MQQKEYKYFVMFMYFSILRIFASCANGAVARMAATLKSSHGFHCISFYPRLTSESLFCHGNMNSQTKDYLQNNSMGKHRFSAFDFI